MLMGPALAAVSPVDKTVNFSFLDSLRREVQAQDGRKIFMWSGAGAQEDSGGGAQGILQNSMTTNFLGSVPASGETLVDACEMARVAAAYLRHWEVGKRKESLRHAREALNFLMSLQDAQGLFSSAVLRDGKLEIKAGDPGKSLDIASARVLRALCCGFRIFLKQDASFARQLEESIRKVFPPIQRSLEDPATGFGKYLEVQGRNMPAWLVGQSSVISGEILLGLCEFEKAAHSDLVTDISRKLAQGIAESQLGTEDEYPFFAFAPDIRSHDRWLAEESCQVAALAEAGHLFNEKRWLQSAQRSVSGILSMLAAGYGPIHGFTPFPETAYQTSSAACALVENLAALHRASGLEFYSILAGLFASWYLGNNPAHVPVYVAETGMGHDSVKNDVLSRNADPQATAEALISFFCLRGTPGERYFSAVEDSVRSFIALEAEKGQAVKKAFEVTPYPGLSADEEPRKLVVVDRQTSFWLKFSIPETENYLIYLIYLKQPFFDSSTAVNLRIDGSKQFTVPMGGSSDAAYLTLQKVADPTLLYLGLHTLGVRYSGLSFTNPAVVDSVILQPVLSRRVFSAEGHRMMLLKSMSSADVSCRLTASVFEGRRVRVTRYTALGKAEGPDLLPPLLQQDAGMEVVVRPGGSTIVEW